MPDMLQGYITTALLATSPPQPAGLIPCGLLAGHGMKLAD